MRLIHGYSNMLLDRLLDHQYRRPSGLVGHYIGRRMARQHEPENAWTVALLDPQPADRILEVGFGPGIAIEALACIVTQGRIAGVDYSRAMIAAASRRNRRAIHEGRVELRYGEASHLPFADGTFDKAYGIHTIYFWPEPATGLKELWRALRPGGLMVMTILPKERWLAAADGSLGTPDCMPYSGAEIAQMMQAAGFAQTRIESDRNTGKASNYSVVGRV
jgi:SAM-dependent methyltransferase